MPFTSWYILVSPKTTTISRRKGINGYYQTISGATRSKTTAEQNNIVSNKKGTDLLFLL